MFGGSAKEAYIRGSAGLITLFFTLSIKLSLYSSSTMVFVWAYSPKFEGVLSNVTIVQLKVLHEGIVN